MGFSVVGWVAPSMESTFFLTETRRLGHMDMFLEHGYACKTYYVLVPISPNLRQIKSKTQNFDKKMKKLKREI